MKTILVLATVFCMAYTSQFIDSFEYKKVSGSIVDSKDDPVIGARIFISGTKKGCISDSLGYFEMTVPLTTRSLSIRHVAFENKEVEILKNENLKIKLKEDKHKSKFDRIHTKEESKDVLFVGASKPKRKAEFSEVTAISESAPPKMFIDEGYVEKEMPLGSREDKISGDIIKNDVDTRAGQLTAGEWNDLNNWEAWLKLVEHADYKEMGDYWQINAKDRVSVFVSNQYELPIPDCLVSMKAGGEIIWTSKTDNAGKAELWVMEGQEDLELIIESKENKFISRRVLRATEGMNRVTFKEECNAPRKAEIMFVVDATGSMGDEIEFLKSELKDVISQVESSRSAIDFSWGSVFYRDATDDYLTVQSPLNSKEKKILDFINMQSAGGGGDYPEAVNEGLEEALMQEWSEDAIARIVFLVLDAPPHHNTEVLNDLQSQIAFASAMGIKIIPITASGINRQTEYLMKFMSIMTNGTYVFLTDHSGIGNAHLDPIVKDFEVEKLNDLLVRLISNYTDPGNCASQDDDDLVFKSIEVFPNPTMDMLQVKVPNGVNKVTLTTSSGMLIHSEEINEQCDVSLDLTTYVDGMYTVNFYTEERVYSVKVIKSNKA